MVRWKRRSGLAVGEHTGLQLFGKSNALSPGSFAA